ncbi:beta-1 [Forsythia ovata]|uniref:Beta-1 n=1 Tax=Forsythia ovata TaxID=205694 RepID=A0ABD1S5F0_9LAMI
MEEIVSAYELVEHPDYSYCLGDAVFRMQKNGVLDVADENYDTLSLTAIGEIRNIKQLRLRFQFFASALQFNLMPDDQTLSSDVTVVHKLRDAIHRVKLRYGLGQTYRKIESSQV